MHSVRQQRVRELLKRHIGEVIQREIPIDKAGLVVVNDVTISGDLQAATVYVGILGTDQQRRKAMDLLKQERPRLQGLVARSVVLKYTPRLRFVLDHAVERGNRVLQIIEEIEKTLPSE